MKASPLRGSGTSSRWFGLSATAPGRTFRALRRPLLFEAGLFGGVLAAASAMALLGFGGPWVWPLLLLPYIGWHLAQLVRLTVLSRRQHRLAPPFPPGLWGEIYRTIAQYQQRRRKRRKRQVRFGRRFREAANSVPDALVILDKHKRIEWANPSAGPLMDVHWPNDDGRPLTEILRHPELHALIDAGEYMRPMDLAPAHNRALMLSLRITPFGERKRQRLVVARDITKIYHLNMIRRDFVANASHELRTPLTVIAGFLETLADSPQTPEGHRRPLNLMRNQSERMRSIIEDLLMLSRLDMVDQTGQPQAVDVWAELHHILHEAQALSEGSHHFTAEIDRDLLVAGHQVELRSAFSNLIFNAVKHTPAGSRIRIAWQRDADGPFFAVEDDGEGIEPEHLPRLTERFYRVDKARSRLSGGTGLGLAIVKHVLNRHNAQLLIASEPGEGSTFTCRFPPERVTRRVDSAAGGSEDASIDADRAPERRVEAAPCGRRSSAGQVSR
ncbi:phosphate regulon sensor histidine kinase PhoR [Thiococcus pfennigii]|uniref:phosphate regulon sensor histidine kinase PhoR n=1 Tax=Thiococcus pfennigii TaxID=1057 RepID=UPI001903C7D0|nr:PAS domain-containing sensor histidine kinase [Thiococcus pfennigii]